MNLRTLVALGSMSLLCSVAHAQTDLNVLFDNNYNNTGYSDSDIYITFEAPSANPDSSAFDITYSGGAFTFASGSELSNSVSLQTIGSGGLKVYEAAGDIAFVSYGAPLTGTGAPSYNPPVGNPVNNFYTPYQPFEITRLGGTGDQGDMTAINYFTAPMSITSYHGGVTGTMLQSTSYNESAATLASQIAGIASGSVVTNPSGQVVRYIGPSSYGSNTNPYPSFIPYAEAAHSNPQVTDISNTSGFNDNTTVGTGETTYHFTFNLATTFASDGSITMTGDITTTLNPYGQAQSTGPTFNDVTVTISASNASKFNQVIYGQAAGDTGIVNYTGTGWTQFLNYATTAFSGANSPQTGAQAVSTVQAQSIGDITSGLLGGFVDSTTQVNGVKVETMPSSQWWTLDPTLLFSQLQSTSTGTMALYNEYSNYIYNASNSEMLDTATGTYVTGFNGAYSVPYSDRFGSGPLVNTVSFDNLSVDTWVVGLDAPVPEPGSWVLLGCICALLSSRFVLKRRAA